MSSIESRGEAAYSFGQLVRARRRELGLTQDELARRVGCAPITLRKIEHDDLRPSVQVAERLAMALNTPLDERTAFVRLARTERTPEFLTITPSPQPEEIGTENLTGRAIRGYALAERIGAGGMGVVYRAVQPGIEREVAIKIILPRYANQPDFIRRFEAEAQIVARLEHPHIIPLYEYWREPNVAFLVMRLLRGGSLRQLLENGALPLDLITRLLEQIGSALGAAHRAGVVHRDLKPANVMLDEGLSAYLADFGIARNLSNPTLSNQPPSEAIIDSLAYISPEQIGSEFVRPQTDIYALGVMLYELLTGTLPFNGPTPNEIMQQHLSVPLPPLAAIRTGLPKAWDDIIACATAKDPLQRYADIESMLKDVRRITHRLGASHGDTSPASNLHAEHPIASLTEGENPYKGLRAFGEGDAQDFFGREALTTQLLARLSEGGDLSRFLSVIGPSGSGKSSVVEAGLIPALRRGGLPGSENWFIVPMLPGPHPLEELEAALLRIAVNPSDSLLTQLREDKRGLLRAVRRCLPADPNVELVLVIDQFEEVFTLVQDEAVRAHLLDSLTTAVLDERSRVRVIVTLRADFIDRPLSYVDFGELLRQRSEFVLPLTPDELEQAIVGPAKRVGLQFEAGLVPTIMRDVGDQPGALPLLQYALTELFEQREDHLLTKAAYQAIGGVLGALGRRAEELYCGLSEPEQVIACQMFLRLVTLGEGAEDTRRRVLRSELEGLAADAASAAQHLSSVIDSFGRARLLTFDHDPVTHGPTVEVAHEALLREWPRLREWLQNNRSSVRQQRLLAQAAADWQNADHDPSFLFSGMRLAQFENLATFSTVALTQQEHAYLEASVAEQHQREAEEVTRQQRELQAAQQIAETERARAEEHARSANRLRRRNRVIAAAGGMALLLAVLAGALGFQSNQNAEAAQRQQSLSRSRELAAIALGQLNQDPERGLLIAIESNNAADTYEAEDALRQLLIALRMRAVLRGHEGSVNSAQFSPDGRQIVTASRDRTARLWDAATGKEVAVLRGHDKSVSSARFAPDGKQIVTTSDDKTVRVWDAATGQEIKRLRGHEGQVYSAEFSPNSKQIVTAGCDKYDDATGLCTSGSARVWDAATGQEVVMLRGHESRVYSAQFSPDGKQIVTASGDQTARVWNVATGQEVVVLRGHENQVYSAAFSPDGKEVVTASDDRTARVWDVATDKEIAMLRGHEDVIYSAQFSPDGKQIVTASRDTTTRLWDAATGQEVALLRGYEGSVNSAQFSPDGKQIVTASEDKIVRVWYAGTGQEVAMLHANGDKVNSAQFSSNGKQIVTASWDRTARLWDTATGQEVIVLRGYEGVPENIMAVMSAQFSPDGKQIVTANLDATARVWDAVTGKEIAVLRGPDAVNSAQFSPDGKQIVTASFDQTARLWDAAAGQEVNVLRGHEGRVNSAQFSSDGKQVVTASDDKTARVWDAATGKEIAVLRGHEGPVHSASFSPDGKQVVTASDDGTARLWDAATGKEISALRGHVGPVNNAQFSPDGKQIVTASVDQTARVWDVATGKEIAMLRGHVGPVNSAQFSPDGKEIVTASDDGTARIYMAHIEGLMLLAKSRITRIQPELTCEERVIYLHEDLVCRTPTPQTKP